MGRAIALRALISLEMRQLTTQEVCFSRQPRNLQTPLLKHVFEVVDFLLACALTFDRFHRSFVLKRIYSFGQRGGVEALLELRPRPIHHICRVTESTSTLLCHLRMA